MTSAKSDLRFESCKVAYGCELSNSTQLNLICLELLENAGKEAR